MAKHGWVVTGLVAMTLCWPGLALSQAPSPETLAAAKELMIAARVTDQIKLVFPAIMQQLRPLVTRGDPKTEKDFDALVPAMQAVLEARMPEFLDENAKIYARHFSLQEMRDVVKFLQTPTGGKFIQQQPEIFKEGMAAGQRFGEVVWQDVQKRMIEELRKRGHKI